MRREARELAFQLIFERLFVKNGYELDEEFFSSLKKDEDKEFALEIIKKYEENKESLFSLISSHLIGYELDRVYKVDLALMLVALTEINYLETPHKVAINEVVTLAKRFSTDKSSRFINGVLSSILKDNN